MSVTPSSYTPPPPNLGRPSLPPSPSALAAANPAALAFQPDSIDQNGGSSNATIIGAVVGGGALLTAAGFTAYALSDKKPASSTKSADTASTKSLTTEPSTTQEETPVAEQESAQATQPQDTQVSVPQTARKTQSRIERSIIDSGGSVGGKSIMKRVKSWLPDFPDDEMPTRESHTERVKTLVRKVRSISGALSLIGIERDELERVRSKFRKPRAEKPSQPETVREDNVASPSRAEASDNESSELPRPQPKTERPRAKHLTDSIPKIRLRLPEEFYEIQETPDFETKYEATRECRLSRHAATPNIPAVSWFWCS